MSHIIAVIGANFGDEGKGYMTDYFCHEENRKGNHVINILGNGGGQRGHTVETTDGKRFIFHHLGAGAITGTDQYFSPDYIVNPLIFLQDYREFYELYAACKEEAPRFDLYMSPDCRFSTPFDMITNQILENWRNQNRHGSVGVGIWETVRRYEKGFGISVSEMRNLSPEEQKHFLLQVKTYFEMRLKEKTGLSPSEMPKWKDIWDHPDLIGHFCDDFSHMARIIPFLPFEQLKLYDTLVIENAQGILLTQDRYNGHNHTTPSDTGAKGIRRLLEAGLKEAADQITLCYVTRSYITKHGAGTFEGECSPDEISPGMTDLTNIPNPFQGTIRYAKMKEDTVISQVMEDQMDLDAYPHKNILSVTHINEFCPDLLLFSRFFPELYISDGREREACKRFEKNDIIR